MITQYDQLVRSIDTINRHDRDPVRVVSLIPALPPAPHFFRALVVDDQVALGDSRRLSVMAAAATSGHIQIMRYLAFTQVGGRGVSTIHRVFTEFHRWVSMPQAWRCCNCCKVGGWGWQGVSRRRVLLFFVRCCSCCSCCRCCCFLASVHPAATQK